ncbi:hypothetical protein [Streptomyces sp. KL116D]|uniref:hypothetical protein n=1 Tax=Streptomyces sp. KL116D TaxID=3045152 RepID=UPI0035560378
MTAGTTFAAAGHGPSPVILGAFLLGGVVAVWTGVNWALDLRGISTRRGAAAPTVFARPGYLRLLGALMAVAGLLLILVAYALWHLG